MGRFNVNDFLLILIVSDVRVALRCDIGRNAGVGIRLQKGISVAVRRENVNNGRLISHTMGNVYSFPGPHLLKQPNWSRRSFSSLISAAADKGFLPNSEMTS